jgi:hypothetical protein
LKRTASEASAAVRAGGLADVDDRRFRRGSHDSGCSSVAPERVEDVAWAVAAECVLAGFDEIRLLLQPNGGIRTESHCAFKSGGTTPGGNDTASAEELCSLYCDQADRACCAGHEHVFARPEGGAPCERQPPRQSCDPESSGKRRICAVGHLDHVRTTYRSSLPERARRRSPERFAENPDDAPVSNTTDCLAPRHARQFGMTDGERSA